MGNNGCQATEARRAKAIGAVMLITDAFDPCARLDLSDADLAALVRFSGFLAYRRPVAAHAVRLHASDVAARIQSRWRETRVRILCEARLRDEVPPRLRMIVECGYRLGPRNASELVCTLGWAHGPSWIEETNNAHDVSRLRDLLANWPEAAVLL